MSKEVWKPVVGYEGYYEVSNKGRVRSLTRIICVAGGVKRPMRGRILRPGNGTDGHQLVGLSKHGVSSTKLVHRLVLLAFVGPPKAGQECRHLNGSPPDNRIENLAWGTAKENQRDRFTHGTDSRGEKSGAAKLTEKDVLTIRAICEAGTELQRSIALRYGVDQTCISLINLRKNWSHI